MFVLSKREEYDSYYVVGIYKTYESSVKKLEEIKSQSGKWVERNKDFWVNEKQGGTYLCIREFELEE
jgi:hypothetical protein